MNAPKPIEPSSWNLRFLVIALGLVGLCFALLAMFQDYKHSKAVKERMELERNCIVRFNVLYK